MNIRNIAALAAASAFALAGSAEAYQCKTKPEAAAVVLGDQGAAIHTSKAVWTSKVKSKFGLEWSVYSIAATPSQTCMPAPGGFQCTVIAKPCKYVVE